MKFDYCIGNPAFNIAEEKNVAGTGGNTTLYKTSARHDFNTRVRDGGKLVLITLKGIIPDLVNGHFKDYQVDYIHLMDNINVWPYNTCFFSVTKKPRESAPKILGGLASKIYSCDVNECFPFIYYGSSNAGLSHKFGPDKPNRVIRQLPGKNRDDFTYDTTDVKVDEGWKFAFYVLESKKSYSVTDEPIYGGTICYIPTSTKEEAEKLKLFVEKNKIFAEYIKRMKLKGHAFGLRNIKKFDLNQIVTGEEIPIEWGILPEDLNEPISFDNNIYEDRNRVKMLGEVFTPDSLVNYVLDHIQEYDDCAFDGSKKFLDSMCGDGQFLVGVKDRQSGNATNLYGIDLTQQNVDRASARTGSSNVVQADSLKYDNKFDELSNINDVMKFGNNLFILE